MNRIQRLGEMGPSVFFTKFKMAENLSRRSLGSRDFFVEQVQVDLEKKDLVI